MRSFLKLRSDSQWQNDQHLFASEWWITASLIQKWFDSSKDGLRLSEIGSRLSSMIEALQKKDLQKAQTEWDLCTQLMGDVVEKEYMQYKKLLAANLAFHAAVESAALQDAPEQKLAFYETAHEQLKEIAQLDANHSKFIVDSLDIPLVSQIEQLRVTVYDRRLGEDATKWENEIARQIQEQLTVAQGKLKWTPLEAWLVKLPRSSLLRANLEEVNFAFEDGIASQALEKTISVVDELTNLGFGPLGVTLRALVLALAKKRIQDTYDQRPYWPVEVQKSLELINAIKNMEGVEIGDQAMLEIERKLAGVREIQKSYNDLVTRNKKVVEDLENEEIDALLQDAYDKRVELIDRISSKAHSRDINNTQTIMASRHSLRMKRLLEEISTVLKDIAISQEGEIEQYRQKEENLRNLKSDINSLSKWFSQKKDDIAALNEHPLLQLINQVLVQWQNDNLQNTISSVEDEIRDLKQASYTKECRVLQLYEQEIGQLEKRLAGLPVEIPRWRRGSRQIKESYIDLEHKCWQTLQRLEQHVFRLPSDFVSISDEQNEQVADRWAGLLQQLSTCLKKIEYRLYMKDLPGGREQEWDRYVDCRVKILKKSVPAEVAKEGTPHNIPT